MAKGKKERESGAKGTKITLKMAKNALRVTPDGKLRLDLSNFGISTFPKCLLKLRNIQELDLSRNKLKTIPEFIGQFSGLHWLDLHSNRIEQLPESIGRLASLIYLNLCNNNLDTAGLLSEIGGLGNLQVLNLGMNRLTTLPPTFVALTNLAELGLFDNLLTEVPKFIHVLPKLRKINTKRNPVTHTIDGKGCESLQMTGDLYLVREKDLCQPCLERCKEERQRLGKNKSSDHKSQRKSHFSGLITPNSVARGNQEIWRQQTFISPERS